jgi:nucleoid-associated protein YgaU
MGLFKRSDDKNDKSPHPDFSNVRGGSSTNAPPPQTTPGAESGAHTHTVIRGESLSKIAKREYGDEGQWRKIYEANRDKIEDPDLIFPGTVLRIP